MTHPLQQIISLNPKKFNSIKTGFTCRFLRALKQLNNKYGSSTIPPAPSRLDQIRQRSYRVKLAANVSMAAAVGSKRAWSRAILWKIRNRQKIGRRHNHALKRKKIIGINPKRDSSFGEAKQLRKLIPGGEGMEIGSLLEETAHYIKCLTTQQNSPINVEATGVGKTNLETLHCTKTASKHAGIKRRTC